MDQPLSGIRVVDLTRVLSGPFCSMLLGDMGADVIKIESPQGDQIRRQGPVIDGLSWYFASFNRNKRSIVIDLKTPRGKAVLKRLLADADVLVENFRAGVLTNMGFSPDELQKINPRLVVGSINGYGSTGPYAERPAFDFIAQAMSGFASVNGTEASGPLRAAPPLSDLIAGLYTALGIVASLRGRDRDGAGQHVEASMLNGMLSMMAYLSADHLATGKTPKPSGNDHPILSPYGLFHAADGPVAVAPSSPQSVERFLDAVGLGHCLADPRFETNSARMERRAELNALINEAMNGKSQDYWINELNAAGVPCGRVQTLDEVFGDPQILSQEMVIDVDHPGHGNVRMTGFPVKFSNTPCRISRPTPDLGADTDDVLRQGGFSEDEIVDLRRQAVVGVPD